MANLFIILGSPISRYFKNPHFAAVAGSGWMEEEVPWMWRWIILFIIIHGWEDWICLCSHYAICGLSSAKTGVLLQSPNDVLTDSGHCRLESTHRIHHWHVTVVLMSWDWVLSSPSSWASKGTCWDDHPNHFLVSLRVLASALFLLGNPFDFAKVMAWFFATNREIGHIMAATFFLKKNIYHISRSLSLSLFLSLPLSLSIYIYNYIIIYIYIYILCSLSKT